MFCLFVVVVAVLLKDYRCLCCAAWPISECCHQVPALSLTPLFLTPIEVLRKQHPFCELRGWQNVSINNLINIVGFVGHAASCTATWCCHCGVEAAVAGGSNGCSYVPIKVQLSNGLQSGFGPWTVCQVLGPSRFCSLTHYAPFPPKSFYTSTSYEGCSHTCMSWTMSFNKYIYLFL